MDITPASIKSGFSHFLRRYHLIAFSVLVLGGLIVCMLLINGIVTKSGDVSGYTPTSTSPAFDKDTMQRISELRSSTDAATDTLNLSNGRSNPFVE